MTLATAKARANKNIVQVSLAIITYDHQNIFIVQATGFFELTICNYGTLTIRMILSFLGRVPYYNGDMGF
jgi:hypothetical protein